MDPGEAQQVLVYWRSFLRMGPVAEDTRAADLAYQLRRVRKTENAAVAKQVGDLDRELGKLDGEIAAKEAGLNTIAYRLYGLTPDEVRLVRSS